MPIMFHEENPNKKQPEPPKKETPKFQGRTWKIGEPKEEPIQKPIEPEPEEELSLEEQIKRDKRPKNGWNSVDK